MVSRSNRSFTRKLQIAYSGTPAVVLSLHNNCALRNLVRPRQRPWQGLPRRAARDHFRNQKMVVGDSACRGDDTTQSPRSNGSEMNFVFIRTVAVEAIQGRIPMVECSHVETAGSGDDRCRSISCPTVATCTPTVVCLPYVEDRRPQHGVQTINCDSSTGSNQNSG